MARLYTDYTLSSRKQLFYYTQRGMGGPEPKKWGFSGTQWVQEPIFWVTMGSFCKILGAGASVAAGRAAAMQLILMGSVTARGTSNRDDASWIEAQSSDSDFDSDYD